MPRSSKFLIGFYIAIGILGFVFTWYHTTPYFGSGFMEANRLFWIDGLVNANPAGKFLAADVLILALACNVFMFTEGRRFKIRYLYLYIVAGLTIAISVAAPFFMAAREAAISRQESTRLSSDESNLKPYDKAAITILSVISLAACIVLFRNQTSS